MAGEQVGWARHQPGGRGDERPLSSGYAGGYPNLHYHQAYQLPPMANLQMGHSWEPRITGPGEPVNSWPGHAHTQHHQHQHPHQHPHQQPLAPAPVGQFSGGGLAGGPPTRPPLDSYPPPAYPFTGNGISHDCNSQGCSQDHGSVRGPVVSQYNRPQPPSGGAPPPPRQRTSIACRYCRRRKIRCSGYATTPGGKCHNCQKMNQECIFVPVSASSSTAFVPVSALPGPLPPGTQLYGSFGEPLGTDTRSHGGPPGPPGGAYPPPHRPRYEQPPRSQTHPNGPYLDDSSHDRGDKRRRTSQETDHSIHLPPMDSNDELRHSSSSSSPNMYSTLSIDQGPAHLQRIPHGRLSSLTPPRVSPTNRHILPIRPMQPQPMPHHRPGSPTPPRLTPPRISPTSAARPSSSGTSVMSLENIVGPSSSNMDYDRHMLGRLDRRAR
ncbi:hypothetical protein F5Y17DRAFT_218988 [Xylariaceae sp. FL0594]|nr:hypothetical protein F5Y17DRAFT_218988 [Xylariaceae sp. FL0594]